MRHSEGPGGWYIPRGNPDSWMQDAEQAPRTTRSHNVAFWVITAFQAGCVLLFLYVIIFAR